MNHGSSIKVTKGVEEAKVVVVDGETEHTLTFPAKTGTLVVDGDLSDFYTKPSGGIPKSDLEQTVQTKLDGAYSKPSNGIPKSDLSQEVQSSLEKADASATHDETILTETYGDIMDSEWKFTPGKIQGYDITMRLLEDAQGVKATPYANGGPLSMTPILLQGDEESLTWNPMGGEAPSWFGDEPLVATRIGKYLLLGEQTEMKIQPKGDYLVPEDLNDITIDGKKLSLEGHTHSIDDIIDYHPIFEEGDAAFSARQTQEVGKKNTASKQGSFAGGEASQALGKNSFAFGDHVTSIGDGAFAFGKNTYAGIYGWYYKYLDLTTGTFYLTSEQPDVRKISDMGPEPEVDSSFESGFAVGDVISYVNKSKHDMCTTVVEVNGNKIVVETLNDKVQEILEEHPNHDDWTIFVPEKPTVG